MSDAFTSGAAAKAKRLLPLYDDRAPIACTITDAEIPDRLAVLARMRAAATGIERIETGLLLTFPRPDRVEADVRRFAVDEKRCCAFWGFAVLEHPGELVLRWDGPPSAGELLDRIERLLRSDDPLESLAGFL